MTPAAEAHFKNQLIFKTDKSANIFTLDTGRLHPETYNVMDETNLKYSTPITPHQREAPIVNNEPFNKFFFI